MFVNIRSFSGGAAISTAEVRESRGGGGTGSRRCGRSRRLYLRSFVSRGGWCAPWSLRAGTGEHAKAKRPNPLDEDVTGRVVVNFCGLQIHTVDTKSTQCDIIKQIRPFCLSLQVSGSSFPTRARILTMTDKFTEIQKESLS